MRFSVVAFLFLVSFAIAGCANRTDDRRVGGGTSRDTGVSATGGGTMNNTTGTVTGATPSGTRTATTSGNVTSSNASSENIEPSAGPAGTIASRPGRAASSNSANSRSDSDTNIIGGIDTTVRGSSPAGTGAAASDAN